MKKLLFLLLIFPFFLSLTSCTEEIREGYIIQKIYEPERTTTFYIKVGRILVPNHITTPEKYYLIIKNEDKTAKYTVSENTYNSYEVGDYITFNSTESDTTNDASSSTLSTQ
jgi:5-keto 4-deoxyuronate isomerase